MSARAARPIRLSLRLTLTYALVFGAILTMLIAGVILGTYAYIFSSAEADVENTVGILSERLLDEYYEGEPINALEVAQGFETNPAFNITLLGPSGEIMIVCKNFDAQESALIERAQIISDDQGVTVASLRIERSLTSERAFLGVMERMLLLFGAAGALIALCVGFVVARRMLRPIQAMTATARRISMSALDERLPVSSSGDELTALAQTFNGMLDRLQEAFARQTRFVSDASHELRTPLMVIQGYADVLDRWGKGDEAVYREAVDAIVREAAGMGALIGKLLFLARGDASQQPLEIALFPMDALLRELEQEYALLAPSRALTFSCPRDARLHADRPMLKQALRALLDNAVKYTAEGGGIRLTARPDGDGTLIAVEDGGIGIAPDDLKHIFDRFYRVNAARDKATGGSGLGLSVAQWIVKAHGGTLHAQSALGEGTTFSIRLPNREEG